MTNFEINLTAIGFKDNLNEIGEKMTTTKTLYSGLLLLLLLQFTHVLA